MFIIANVPRVCVGRIINDKLNKMNESVIIQKLIQVGQMLERGELEYSGAEIDIKHYLEQYVALRQTIVVGRSEQLSCGRNITTCVFYKDGGKCSNLEYCRDQTT